MCDGGLLGTSPGSRRTDCRVSVYTLYKYQTTTVEHDFSGGRHKNLVLALVESVHRERCYATFAPTLSLSHQPYISNEFFEFCRSPTHLIYFHTSFRRTKSNTFFYIDNKVRTIFGHQRPIIVLRIKV